MDCNSIHETFGHLRYEIEIYENLRAYELKELVDNLAGQDYSSYGSLVICLLSHGDEGKFGVLFLKIIIINKFCLICIGTVEGTDGIPVNINKLKYRFGFNQCPTLYGKPKIFIVQACQGNMRQTIFGPELLSGMNFQFTTFLKIAQNKVDFIKSASAMTGEMVVGNSMLDELPDEIYIMTTQGPPLIDFITIKATLPGFVSLRNTATGKTDPTAFLTFLKF